MQREITVYEDASKTVTITTVPVGSLARTDGTDEALVSQVKEFLVYSGRLTHDQVAKAIFVLPLKE